MMRRALIAGLALACGCTDDPLTPASGPLRGELSLDIRDRAEIEIRGSGPSLEVMAKLSRGFGLVPEGAALTGKGREEAFPEAAMTLYTARFDAPPAPGQRVRRLSRVARLEPPHAAGRARGGVAYGVLRSGGISWRARSRPPARGRSKSLKSRILARSRASSSNGFKVRARA